nr:tyrosine-type recombinase/integrase [Saccharibacillus sacchari]
MFSKSDGYPLSSKRFIQKMRSILKQTTIKKNATPHIFRHTFISLLAEASVPLPMIMKRVGHDDAKTTLKIYTHVTSKMQIDADQKISEMYADLLDIPFKGDFAENVIKT